MKGTLELTGMKFHAFHGCLDFERIQGAEYIVDFRTEIEMDQAIKSDKLDNTLDYSKIYDLIKKEMSIPSSLIENVAGRIMASISESFPNLEHFTIKLSKLCPPVNGPADKASITLSR